MADALTVARVLLIFVVIAVWSRDGGVTSGVIDLAMVPLLAVAIFMDAVDGWVARRMNEASEAGALFDIAGDRIVELALWTFFAIREDASGQPLVPHWVPILIITRTVLTDHVRTVAFGKGRTPFGEQGMQASGWARQLTASRWSRAAYGILKAVCFCALGLLLAWPHLASSSDLGALARAAVAALVYLTTAFAVIRGVPVLWDGWRYIAPARRAKPSAGVLSPGADDPPSEDPQRGDSN